MLLLPKKFDENEIFILIIGFFLTLLVLILPRKFSLTETVLIFLFNFYLAAVVDHIIAGPPLNLYDIMDDPKFEIMDLFMYLFVYTSSGYLFIYGYTYFSRPWYKSTAYVLAVALFTVGLEWIAHNFLVFKYFEWSIYFSMIAYVILFTVNIYFFKLVRHLLRNAHVPGQ